MAMSVREVLDRDEWSGIVTDFRAHPLQSWGWGDLKERTGSWTARRMACERDGAVCGGGQVLVRKLPWPFGNICYIPRGPIAKTPAEAAEVADALAAWCKEHVSAVSVKIDPALTVDEACFGSAWRPASRVLLAKTAVIDLAPSEDDIMKGIHSKKARQYIRKAGRDGVVVRRATREDLPAIMSIYHNTAESDDFFIHTDEYYETAFDACSDTNQLFIAEFEGEPQAFLWNVTTSGAAFELWGGVTDEGKRLRANYLLKWTAICAAKESGALLYDLNGLFNDGISRFKLLFVSGPTEWVGALDRPLSPLYSAWELALKVYRRLFK